MFLAGLISLPFLPNAGPIVAVAIGGLLVWGGFIQTLMAYYVPGQQKAAEGDARAGPSERR
jgi:hypothetical protein